MSSGAPCGACKFLRRKCVRNCIFAPYFTSEQGAARFAAVHKVFGASNVSKLLQDIPVAKRCDAVLTISYEAQARLSDPVYGCVATIVALQHQVASLQAELASIQSQLSKCMAAAAAAAAAQQQQRQHMSASYDMQQNLAINSLSMALPGTSSSGGYPRVKEEGPYHPVHNYEIGMPSSLDLMHNVEALQHKHTTRTSPNGDPEELQALAHALLGRK